MAAEQQGGDGGSDNGNGNNNDNSNSPAAEIVDTRKSIAQPPLNLLFNPSLLVKRDRDIWSIDVVQLLEVFLRLLNTAGGNKDLRICGIAAVSSSMIYRLKVESIFALEKIAMQKKALAGPDAQAPIPQLNPLEIPFRIESTYPVSVEDLLHVLESMIMELANPKPKKRQVELEPVQTFDFDQYLVKFEQVIQRYEDMIFDIVSADGALMFKSLVARMEPVEMARCFIAMLYLAMKGRVVLEQPDGSDDVRIILKGQPLPPSPSSLPPSPLAPPPTPPAAPSAADPNQLPPEEEQ